MSYYVIIRGPLGCGKTTIAKELSVRLKAGYLAMDRLVNQNGWDKDQEGGYVSQASFLKANEAIAGPARDFLKKGVPVVFDGNFYWRSQIEDLTKRLDFSHYVFSLTASVETCIARDRERGKTLGEDAARAVYTKSSAIKYGITIDVNRPLEECLMKILSLIPDVKGEARDR